MGPVETSDLNAPGGIADYARHLGPLFHSIAASTREHRVGDEALMRSAVPYCPRKTSPSAKRGGIGG